MIHIADTTDIVERGSERRDKINKENEMGQIQKKARQQHRKYLHNG